MSVVSVTWQPFKRSSLTSLSRTTTVSLRSSIFDHVEEGGRTYHRYREGSKTFSPNIQIEPSNFPEYPLPNDEEEQERLGRYKSSM